MVDDDDWYDWDTSRGRVIAESPKGFETKVLDASGEPYILTPKHRPIGYNLKPRTLLRAKNG